MVRTLIITIYLLLTGITIYGIASVFEYLSQGADRNSMLKTQLVQQPNYAPKINWVVAENTGKPIGKQSLQEIEKDYKQAWYVKYASLQINQNAGIDDYYTQSARKNLYAILEDNKKKNVHIEGTSLEHNLSLKYYSSDGKIAVLSDSAVVAYTRIFKEEELITTTKQLSSYKVTMLLEDGFWRIRHLERTASNTLKAEPVALDSVTNVVGINYYPKDTPWDMYGERFDANVIEKDLEIIRAANLKSIRIFVPYSDFGEENVDPIKLQQLEKILDLAQARDLKVLITLFDFYGDYSLLNWSKTNQHATQIVSSLKNHPALMGWDLKNEPNLDFENRGQNLVMFWLQAMLRTVKKIDPQHPVTIGWSDAQSAQLLYNELDFVSFHYYEDLDELPKIYSELKKSIPDKKIVITEYGYSSYSGIWNPLTNAEEKQALYHKEIQSIFKQQCIPFMSWTLYDFEHIPGEKFGSIPWQIKKQMYFGFLNSKGEPKPSFKFMYKP